MTRRVTGQALLALLATGGLLVAALLAAWVVSRGDVVEDDGEPTTLLLSGQADVPAGQVHDDVFLLRGTAVVKGTVEDDVVVVDGRARIEGTVHGDVMVLRGDAVVTRGAEIDGDVRTSQPARISRRATVRGDVGDAGPLDAVTAIPLLAWFATWFAAGLAVLLLLGVVRRPVADAATAGVRRPGRAFGLGALLLVAMPLVIAVLAMSLLGSLVALVLGAGLVVATALGAAVAGSALGRLVLPRRDGLAPYVGWAGVGGVLALALLVSPLAGLLLAGVAVTFGVGALVPARPSATPAPAPVEDEPVPEDRDDLDDLDWDALLPDEPTADADDSQPRILAAFPLSNGSSRD